MPLNTSMNALLHNMNAQRINVEPRRCISVRNRNAACQRCVDACATGALFRQEDDVAVDAGKCIGCGTCASACPTAAITLAHPSAADVAATAKDSLAAFSGQTMLCCSRAAQDAGFDGATLQQAHICLLACLGHVDESLLAEQAARRARRVNVIHGDCPACDHVRGGSLCAEVCRSTQRLLAAFGNDCVIDFTETWPEEALHAIAKAQSGTANAGADGRHGQDTRDGGDFDECLQNANGDASSGDATGTDGVTAGAGAGARADKLAAAPATSQHDDAIFLQDLYDKVGEGGTLSHHIPLKRARLFNCLEHLGQPQDVEVETRLVGRVAIDTGKCMSCRMCSVFCPTGALVQKGDPADQEERFGLLHRPTLCMQCRCCEQICAKGAVKVTGKMPLRQFIGKEEIFLELPRPAWRPNTPESMYDRFADMIGRDKNTGHF